jgi:hypothetical protein
MPMIVYRYDNESHGKNTIVRSRGEFFDSLTESQKQVELAIRATLLDGVNIRSNSLYAWVDEQLAKRIWPLSKTKHLYELEIQEFNIRHIGDLNWYSAAVDAVKSQMPSEIYIKNYCSGVLSGLPFTTPRLEILVSEAKVLTNLV